MELTYEEMQAENLQTSLVRLIENRICFDCWRKISHLLLLTRSSKAETVLANVICR